MLLLSLRNYAVAATSCKLCSNRAADFEVKFEHKYSPAEEDTILNLVNTCSLDDLKRHKTSQARANKLITHRKKYGDFQSLHQLLTVETFGTRILNSLCQSILSPTVGDESKHFKRVKAYQFVTPELELERVRKIKRVVGVSLGPLSLSWAGIDAIDGSMFSWGYHAIPLPPEIKRHHESQILDVAYEAHSYLPPSDAYVLESSWSVGRTQQSANVSVNQFRLQLSAMLAVLLNQPSRDLGEDCKVIFQRSSLWCRLYGTLVGAERVSVSSAVEKVLSGGPGPFSPIIAPPSLRDEYYSRPPLQREAMGSAFLLTQCFVDVNLKSLPECLKILRGRAR